MNLIKPLKTIWAAWQRTLRSYGQQVMIHAVPMDLKMVLGETSAASTLKTGILP